MRSLLCLTEKNNLPPFLFPLLSLILGIYWQNYYGYSQNFSATIVFVLLTVIFLQKNNFTTLKTQLFLFFIFFFSGAFLLLHQKKEPLYFLKNISNKKLDLIAQVVDKEQIFSNGKNKEFLQIRVKNIKEHFRYKYKETNFYLNFYLHEKISPNIGDFIEIRNIFISTPFQNKTLSNNPTFNDYLIKENIFTTIFKKKLYCKTLLSPSFSILKTINQIKTSIYNSLKTKLLPKTFHYFSFMFLGKKEKNDNYDLRNIFNFWGISHFLARSGLHIMLFILIWNFFLSFLPLTLFFKRIFMLSICISYNIFSWTSISFARAFYTFILYETGKLFYRQTNFLHLLSIVCFTILILNPIQLFFLDFQLSFGLTFALAILSQISLNNILK